MTQLILIGMPRSGKSTIGEQVATKLKIPFYDIDKKALERAGLSSIQESDLERFRKHERDVFEELVTEKSGIIATGGNTPLIVPNFQELTDDSSVVFLYSQWEQIWKRIDKEGSTPLFLDPNNPEDSFKELYKSRLVHYLHFAHYRIDTTKLRQDEVVERLVRLVTVGSAAAAG